MQFTRANSIAILAFCSSLPAAYAQGGVYGSPSPSDTSMVNSDIVPFTPEPTPVCTEETTLVDTPEPTPVTTGASSRVDTPVPITPSATSVSIRVDTPVPYTPTVTEASSCVDTPVPITPSATSETVRVDTPVPYTPTTTEASSRVDTPVPITPSATSETARVDTPVPITPVATDTSATSQVDTPAPTPVTETSATGLVNTDIVPITPSSPAQVVTVTVYPDVCYPKTTAVATTKEAPYPTGNAPAPYEPTGGVASGTGLNYGPRPSTTAPIAQGSASGFSVSFSGLAMVAAAGFLFA